MAEITRKRTGELLQKLFAFLLATPEGTKGSVALSALADSVSMSEYESGFYPSGGQRFEKIVRFATVDCVKAGWMEKVRGVWTVTEAGKTALATYPDPEQFYKEAVKLYKIWKAQAVAGVAPEVIDDPSLGAINDDDQTVSVSFEQAEEQAWSEIELRARNNGSIRISGPRR